MSNEFLRNTWYMVAWSDEVQEKPLARRVLNEPLVIFRAQGELSAILDRCPHRFAPLSAGQVVDGNIECPYHGLQFNSSGQCVFNPFSNAVPTAARVPDYPIHEVDNIIWVWMGDKDKANTETIPVIDLHRNPDLHYVKGYTLGKADYRLFSDNLMDLSHTYMVHPGLGGRDYLPKVRSWEDESGHVVATFSISDMPNPFGREVIDSELVEYCDTMRWVPPSIHLLESRGAVPGCSERAAVIDSTHILTPETETTTHYFWSSFCPSGVPDEVMLDVLCQAFDNEDKPMIEMVQQRMDGRELWELEPVLLASDAGGVRVRRKLEGMVQAEQSSERD